MYIKRRLSVSEARKCVYIIGGPGVVRIDEKGK